MQILPDGLLKNNRILILTIQFIFGFYVVINVIVTAYSIIFGICVILTDGNKYLTQLLYKYELSNHQMLREIVKIHVDLIE